MHHCIECLAPYCIDIPLLVLFLYLCVEDVDKQGSKCNAMLYLKIESGRLETYVCKVDLCHTLLESNAIVATS